MKYLIIDGALNGTGIRDYYQGGYINPNDLELTLETKQKLSSWISRYENEHYNGFSNESIIDSLDQEGKKIAFLIKKELPLVKIEYFSDARMKKESIE